MQLALNPVGRCLSDIIRRFNVRDCHFSLSPFQTPMCRAILDLTEKLSGVCKLQWPTKLSLPTYWQISLDDLLER